MQANPLESIKLAYLIGDTGDSTTYYVQAVMRDSGTGTTLATTNLTGSGRRFTGSIKAPADTTGRGRWVDITYTVYTDTGYSVLSGYPEQVFSYRVQEQISAALLAAGATSRDVAMGAGSGDDINYKKIKSIFVEALKVAVTELQTSMQKAVDSIEPAEAPEAGEAPEMPSVEEIASALSEAVIASLRPDIQGVGTKVEGVEKAVQTGTQEVKEAVESAKTDLTDVLDSIDELGLSQEAFIDEVKPSMYDVITNAIEKGFETTKETGVYAVVGALGPVKREEDGNREPPVAPKKRSREDYMEAARSIIGKPSKS